MIIQGERNDSETFVGLHVVKLLSQVLLIGRIPLNDRVVKLVKLVIFVVSWIAFRGSACWPVEIEVVSGRVELVDNVVDKGPKIAWVVKSCIEELAGICGQINDANLRKKNIKDIKISGLAWVKEAVCRKSCVPVVESNGEVAEAVSEPVADNEVLGVLDDSIDEVTEAANPSELRLPAVGGSSIVSSPGGYESFDIGVAFETRKKQLKLWGRN
jgi:hypothetical protein